jgi:nicotinamidase-related amidase
MPVARNQVLPVLEAAAKAMAYFRSTGSPIVAVGNEFKRSDLLLNVLRRFATVAGTPGCVWDERLPLDGAPYFPKWGGSAFVNPGLEPWLREHGVEEVVLAGLYARACITATAKAALKRGFRVSTLNEAIACASDETRARALARLHARGASRMSL